MQKHEILRKAIEKAVANGWGEGRMWLDTIVYVGGIRVSPKDPWDNEGKAAEYASQIIQWDKMKDVEARVLFDHSFARAYWGEEWNRSCKHRDAINYDCPAHHLPCDTNWQFHLQQLVLAEDRLGYIEKFLD